MIKYMLIILFLPISLNAKDILTAEEAIRIGLKKNYDVQIVRNDVEIAKNDRRRRTAGFLPTLDAQGNYQYSSSDQETNSPIGFGNSSSENIGGSISFHWTLFDGFQMFANKTRYEELAKSGNYQARYEIENTVVSILRAYFNLVQQEQLLDVAKNSKEVSETRLNKTEIRRNLGGTSAVDYFNARVSFNNDVASVLNRELEVTIARKNLNILLGQYPDTPVLVEKKIIIEDVEFEYEKLIEMAEERNSFLLVSRQNKSLAEQDIRIAKSAFYPRLILNANYGYSDSKTTRDVSDGDSFFPKTVNSQNSDAVVGLTLSFNLFNGFRNKINLQNAKLQAYNRKLAVADVKNQITGMVLEKYNTFKKQIELVKLEEQNVVVAQQNLDLHLDRYNLGTANSLEFRDAQINLIRTQSSLIAARYQARIIKLEIEQLIGTISID